MPSFWSVLITKAFHPIFSISPFSFLYATIITAHPGLRLVLWVYTNIFTFKPALGIKCIYRNIVYWGLESEFLKPASIASTLGEHFRMLLTKIYTILLHFTIMHLSECTRTNNQDSTFGLETQD